MPESFVSKIQKLRRIAIPVEVFQLMKLQEGQTIRVTVECVQSDRKEKMSPETQEGRSIPRSFSHDQTHIGPVRDNSSCVDEETKKEG